MKQIYILLLSAMLAIGSADAAIVKTAKTRHATAKAPTTLPATNVTSKSFTANWKPYSGASLYQVMVYEPIQVETDDTYCVLQEGFDYITVGTYDDPEFPDDWVVYLSDAGYTDTPDWMAYMPVLAKGMVGGIVYSPYIDLTNNDGTFTVVLTLEGYAGSKVVLKSTGATEEKQEYVCTVTGTNEASFTFTNGSHDTFLTYIDYGIENDTEGQYTDYYCFITDFSIFQDLKAGDQFLRLVQEVETEEDSGDTSYDFTDMTFRNGAKNLAYDVMAITVTYNDPDDPWDYDIDYSDFSSLEYVTLGGSDSQIDAIATPTEAEYYNLQGVKVSKDAMAPGLYIRRTGDKAEKIMVK
jgi:hypothetical protein